MARLATTTTTITRQCRPAVTNVTPVVRCAYKCAATPSAACQYRHTLCHNTAIITTPTLRRTFASITTTSTTKEQFHTATEQFFDTVQDRLEQPDIEMNPDVDAQYTDGVLTLKHEDHTWVINQHGVTRQLWLSSPVSGPSKYNYHADVSKWQNERDGKSRISDLLSKEWSDALKVNVDFANEF